MSMKKFIVIMMALGLSSTAFTRVQGDVKIGSKKIVKSVKKI